MKTCNINLFLFCLLILVLLAKIPLISIAQSQQNQTTQKEQNNQSNQTNQPQRKRSTLEAILAIFKERQKQKLGSRGVCLVSPGILEKETNTIWHNQPLFVWQGNSSKVEIRLYTADNPRKPIWRQQVTQNSSELILQQIAYTGKPLELGKIYDWEIFDANDKSQEIRSFQIMDIEQYNSINEELTNLEKQLKQQQLTEAEIKLTEAEITVKKANYFAEKGLFSDAITELSSLDNLSPEIEQEIQDSLNQFCITPQQ